MIFNIPLNKKQIELMIQALRKERFRLMSRLAHDELTMGAHATLRADEQTIGSMLKALKLTLRQHNQQ